MKTSRLLSVCVAGLGFSRAVEAVTIAVSNTGGNITSPYQYGIMFEDISHSGDGGIYAELIQNRAFQGSSAHPSTIHPWTAVGDAVLALDNSLSLSAALPTSLRVTATSDGTIGIRNPGWWGISVKGANTYQGSFYVRGDYDGNFTVLIVSDKANETLALASVVSESTADAWTQHKFELSPPSDAENTNNSFALFYDGTAGESLNFNLVSLFPPTYQNRPNGNRPDLMRVLKDLNPSYFRIPGGNNMCVGMACLQPCSSSVRVTLTGSREGNGPPHYWKWNASIGDLKDRPGRPGTWGYENTDGLGLLEYLGWCEDLQVEPVLAVWGGFYLNGSTISEEDLDPYVDDALNALEFCMGDAETTTYGALRASLGRPNPFNIHFVEVGNEDNLNGGSASYAAYRLNMFYDAITTTYPEVLVFSSTTNSVVGQSGQDYHEYAVGFPHGR